MPPGDYELRQITAQSSSCSFRMEDTTINIIAPNEMISASAKSNGPLCEFSNLELNGSISPAGNIRWKGLLGYRSNEQNPSRLNVDTSQSGIYEIIASYGICEQSEFLEIDIASRINASIEAKDEYCERDIPIGEELEEILEFHPDLHREPMTFHFCNEHCCSAGMSSKRDDFRKLFRNFNPNTH